MSGVASVQNEDALRLTAKSSSEIIDSATGDNPAGTTAAYRPRWWCDGILVEESVFPWLFSCFYPVGGITLWPFILLRKGFGDEQVHNHERIHIRQANEMLVLGMYVLWIWDFMRGLCKYGYDPEMAYLHIRLEQEAMEHEGDFDYLRRRKHYAWTQYSV